MPIPVENLIAIEGASEKFAQALNKGDISAVADLFSANAVVLAPNRNPAKGSGVLEFLRNMALQNEGIRLLSTEMEPVGTDTVRDVGTLSLRMKRQKEERLFYKYLMLWQKVGSDWRVTSMMWNRAAPTNRQNRGNPAGQATGGQATGEM